MLRRTVGWFLIMLMAVLPLTALGEEVVLVDGIANPDAAAAFAFPEGAELLEIIFPQVRDCDAALLRCGGQSILIDCASPAQAWRVTDMLEQLDVTRLDYIINTHPHYDHIGGFGEIADAVAVGGLYISFPENADEQMRQAVQAAASRNVPVRPYGDGDRLTLGDAVMDVWMKYPDTGSLNDCSAVIRVQFGERTALFTADITVRAQKLLMEQVDPALLDIDLLKYPHHGKEGLAKGFLEAMSPRYAVITNNGGVNSRPSRRVLGYAHIPFSVTVPGYVRCVTDGHIWVVDRIAMDHPIVMTPRPETP
ncbi:MAG: ComEC/Rec2 family competence protein [Aristaeellaceae bacterium]